MPSIMWKEHKFGKGAGSKERKKSSYTRRRENSEMGNGGQGGLGKDEEVEEDHKKIKEIIPKRFLKWRKMFGKVELERIPTRKIWDHTIDLKETFKP